jgi:uncharacterized protein (TIRG00374 family)
MQEMSQEKHGRGSEQAPWWRRPTIVANIVFVLAIIGVSLQFGKGEHFARLLTQINPWWILLAIAFQVATYFCFAGLLVATLRIFDKKVHLREVAALSVAKLFIDQVVPTLGVGGSLMVMRGLTRRNASRGEAMAATVTEIISRWLAYFLFFAIALFLLWHYTEVTRSVRYIALGFSIFFVIVISVLGYLIWSARRRRLPQWIKNLKFLKPALDALAEVPHKALYSKQLWMYSFVLQGLIFLLDSATLWASLRALGAHVSPLTAFISFMMASAIATLSLIPGGLGFFEGVAIGVLASLGVSFEAGVAASVLLRGFTYWIPMIPGFFIFHREMRKEIKS